MRSTLQRGLLYVSLFATAMASWACSSDAPRVGRIAPKIVARSWVNADVAGPPPLEGRLVLVEFFSPT